MVTHSSLRRIAQFAFVGIFCLPLACVEEGAVEELESSQAALTSNLETEVLEFEEDVEPVDPIFLLDLPTNYSARALFEEGVAHIESSDRFQQVSWMMDAGDVSGLQFQALTRSGEWTEWAPVEITFEEGQMKNALIRLEEPTLEMKMRGGEEIESALMEFYEEVIARQEFVPNPAAPEMGTVEDPTMDGEDLRITRQASVAPSNLVIPRSNWGATNPNKVCGNVVAPYRVAIHHTYRPASDGGNPAARMRSMQSYHMNNLGWCDIGYHFVVSQSGHIYQGRSRSDRPGAHVGGQNSGNVGISFIADFTTQTPTNTQMDAGARIMRWVRDHHGVALNRNTVKGHREHSGQATSCPGGMVNHLGDLINRANGTAGTSTAPTAPPPSSSTTTSSPTSSSSNTGSTGSSSSPQYSLQPAGCSAMGSGEEAPLGLLLLGALGLVVLRRKKA